MPILDRSFVYALGALSTLLAAAPSGLAQQTDDPRPDPGFSILDPDAEQEEATSTATDDAPAAMQAAIAGPWLDREQYLQARGNRSDAVIRTDDWPLYDPDTELIEVNKPSKPEGYQSKDWERPSIPE
mgnify:CR=1 FL=1